ncbi:hypothetical protein [Streptomyces sp. NPDC058108]|uniref:hypothetical protein n=1 Tax=Streptomyces sp. NPDC058108 TaxID=3346344 RepID=UPI0036E5A227
MNLRDAKAQVEREQPHLTGTAKIEAIKALRTQGRQAAADQAERNATQSPISVGEAWGLLAFVFVGMRVISYFVWGSITGGPHWYDTLYVVALVTAIAGLVSAYRRRGKSGS